MVRCSFCGEQIEQGTGTMFVHKTGKIVYLCSSKCKRNLLVLKRKPLNTKWTIFNK